MRGHDLEEMAGTVTILLCDVDFIVYTQLCHVYHPLGNLAGRLVPGVGLRDREWVQAATNLRSMSRWPHNISWLGGRRWRTRHVARPASTSQQRAGSRCNITKLARTLLLPCSLFPTKFLHVSSPLSRLRFGLPNMPEGSTSKGKMPVSATAKHADAEGYEMPW